MHALAQCARKFFFRGTGLPTVMRKWFRGRILGGNVCKNRPLVPRSNIAGSWARRGGGGVPLMRLLLC